MGFDSRLKKIEWEVINQADLAMDMDECQKYVNVAINLQCP